MTNQPKQSTSSPLGALCARHGISLARLSDLCGGRFASRSTVHRLLRNELAPDYEAKLLKILAETLPKCLLEKGLNASEIDKELLQIFDKGEYQPMISQRLELTPDAIRHFGLTQDPFSNPPQHRGEVFISPALQQIVDRVVDAIRYQGFVTVIGEIGRGKSTLRALVADQLESNNNLVVVRPEFFDMKVVSPMQIAGAILEHFDAKVPGPSVRRGNAVKNLLARLYKDGTRVALDIDEGHRMNDAAMSSLKNFLEMNSGGFQRYLGVVIWGQPILEARLREAHFREIFERIVPLRMPDFTDEARGYLAHRLQLVGGDIAELFDEEAIDLVCRQAKTPLALGNIANEAMMVSMTAFNNTKVIGSAIKTKMFFENPKEQPNWTRRKSA